MRILLAEDERDMNKIITKKLISEGYGVDSCFDGEEALLYIESSDYDGIILDIMMPKLDGFNVGTILSREKIENHIWSYDYDGGSNIVDVYIRYLRKKIDAGYDKKLIHTVRGTGYVIREML